MTGTPSGNVSYAYDAFGRRMSKTVGSSTTYYLYDGDALIAEVDASTDQVTTAYTWGADGLVSDHAGTQSRFYLFDALGNARSLMDSNGNLLATAAYTAYGTPIGTPLPSTPFGWHGEAGCRTDSETGLVFMEARYYSPALGRFVSRDPIGFDGGINLYAYCYGDPINYIDPGGMDGSPYLVFDAQDTLMGVKMGFAALGYAFSFTLWKPGEEYTSAPGWDASKYCAGVGAGATYAAAALAAPGIIAKASPYVTRFLNPVTATTLSTLAAKDAENPAAEEETIEQDGTNCLNAIEEELQNAEKRITVSRWGRPGLQPGDWVMKGKANYWNYVRSGKWDPFKWNQFAPFSSGQEYEVPVSSIKWPTGLGIDGWWKGLIYGQRIYNPD